MQPRRLRRQSDPRQPVPIRATTTARAGTHSCAAWLGGTVLVLAVGHLFGAALESPLIVTQVPREALTTGPVNSPHPLVTEPVFNSSRLVIVAPDGAQRVLTEGFQAARDPDVSFDGRRVLFSGKAQPSDPWQVWELHLDGTEPPRAITPPNLPARSPIYVSTLFTLDSPEPWLTTVFVGQHLTPTESGLPLTASLYNIKLDGTELRRLTDNPSHSLDPFQTWDGRVLYTTERHPQEPTTRPAHLAIHAIHIEGADMEFYGGAQGRRIQRMPCATDTGLVVFVESDTPQPDGSGQLACVAQNRPTVTYQPLTQPGSHQYLYPAPLQRHTILVAQRPVHSSAPFRIVSFNLETRATQPLLDTPEFHNLQAKPLRPRPSPDGHSTVVELGHRTGTFYGMNCYTADELRQDHLQPGDIKRVRFIEGVPATPTSDPAHPDPWPVTLRRLIGEAPVEPDGSFNVEVPPISRSSSKPSMTTGSPSAPAAGSGSNPRKPAAASAATKTPSSPRKRVRPRPAPSLHPPHPPPDQRRALSFRHDIAPLLQQQCAAADCHGGHESPLRLPLGGPTVSETDLRAAYAALLAPADSPTHPNPPRPGKYLDPGRARTSWLVWQLLGTHTGRPWDPEPQPRPPWTNAAPRLRNPTHPRRNDPYPHPMDRSGRPVRPTHRPASPPPNLSSTTPRARPDEYPSPQRPLRRCPRRALPRLPAPVAQNALPLAHLHRRHRARRHHASNTASAISSSATSSKPPARRPLLRLQQRRPASTSTSSTAAGIRTSATTAAARSAASCATPSTATTATAPSPTSPTRPASAATRTATAWPPPAADYDQDGFLDLYVCNYGRKILYRNNGDGTFTDVTDRAGVASPGWSVAAPWFDYNGDGLLDLFVVHYLEYDKGAVPTHRRLLQGR
jgi:hypothetical protein